MNPLVNVVVAASLAAPVPTGPGALTKNPIYATGKLPQVTCEEKMFNPARFDSVQLYVEDISDCLEQAWRPQLAKAGIPFSKPRLVVKGGKRIKACGFSGEPYETFSMYCLKNKTIYMLIPDRSLADELNRPTILLSLARGYGYHIQQLTGIVGQQLKAEKKLSKRGLLAQRKRFELQTTCFAGAFLGSVWDSLGHTAEPSSEHMLWVLVNTTIGPSQGSTKNRTYWATRGYESWSPGSCNTFTAPAKRVS
ncbi:hypothetical protein Aple_012910 [Acrocarpospora pleiomorpha]|uniref:Metalloprotease n=1 Tax=Acrocarpospora pleiomorpha TaxID=90975 RepID=A0A5M3XCL3_9ACTN|nr:neutral zinc metallopeptidase [Acrocarpospora pleiomorpha]GES18396.1 hypothetical protein Aple_012910 [Acrocarpospora pleiomorpha]